MDARADRVLDEATVLRVVRRHLPMAQRVVGVDERGYEARVYVIDEAYVLKCQRPQRVRPMTSLLKEANVLEALAPLPITLPVVLGSGSYEGQGGAAVQYLLTTRLPGEALSRLPDLEPSARRAVLAAFGEALSFIHGMELAPEWEPGTLPQEFETPTQLAEQLRRRIAVGLARGRDLQVSSTAALTACAERLLRWLPVLLQRPIARLLHFDSLPRHVYVDAQRQRFVGIIDFGDACLGLPAWDLFHWLQPQDREGIVTGYLSHGDPFGLQESLPFWIGLRSFEALTKERPAPWARTELLRWLDA